MSLEQKLQENTDAINRNTEVLLKCLEVRLNGAEAAGVKVATEEPKAEAPKRTRAAKATTTEAVETPAAEAPETTEPEAETPATDPAAGYKSANNLTPATPGEERAPDPVVDDAATEDKLILEITNTVRSAITRDKNTAGDVKLAWRDICKSLGVDTIADLKGKGRTKDLGHALSRAREL